MRVIVLQRKCPLAISKWGKLKTLKRLCIFFTFFDMTLQKFKKSRFLDFEKNVKKPLKYTAAAYCHNYAFCVLLLALKAVVKTES